MVALPSSQQALRSLLLPDKDQVKEEVTGCVTPMSSLELEDESLPLLHSSRGKRDLPVPTFGVLKLGL